MNETAIIRLEPKTVPFSSPIGCAQAVRINTAIVTTSKNSVFHFFLEPISPVILEDALNHLFENDLKLVKPHYCEIYYRNPSASDKNLQIIKISYDLICNEHERYFEFSSYDMSQEDMRSFDMVFGANQKLKY